MQARLTNVLGLHHTNSTVSLDSITSFAGSINTKKVYKEFCQNLYQIRVTAEMISQKKSEIFNIFQPQNVAISVQKNGSNIAVQSQLLRVSDFCYV